MSYNLSTNPGMCSSSTANGVSKSRSGHCDSATGYEWVVMNVKARYFESADRIASTPTILPLNRPKRHFHVRNPTEHGAPKMFLGILTAEYCQGGHTSLFKAIGWVDMCAYGCSVTPNTNPAISIGIPSLLLRVPR